MEGEKSAKEAGREWAGVEGKPHGTRSAKVRRHPGGGGYCVQGKPWVLAHS